MIHGCRQLLMNVDVVKDFGLVRADTTTALNPGIGEMLRPFLAKQQYGVLGRHKWTLIRGSPS